jgi:hypothetical protein
MRAHREPVGSRAVDYQKQIQNPLMDGPKLFGLLSAGQRLADSDKDARRHGH